MGNLENFGQLFFIKLGGNFRQLFWNISNFWQLFRKISNFSAAFWVYFSNFRETFWQLVDRPTIHIDPQRSTTAAARVHTNFLRLVFASGYVNTGWPQLFHAFLGKVICVLKSCPAFAKMFIKTYQNFWSGRLPHFRTRLTAALE